MLGFFKKRRPPADPPTPKHRRYAAKIGIEVQPTATKAELSYAIADAERRNPNLAEQRERAKNRGREKRFTKELVDEADRWSRFAAQGGYMLAIYARRKETIVDVLRVNEAFINDQGALKLGVEAPKLVKDRHIGDYLDWDRCFKLPLDSLLYHEPVDPESSSQHTNGFGPGKRAYRALVKRGLKIARNL